MVAPEVLRQASGFCSAMLRGGFFRSLKSQNSFIFKDFLGSFR